MLLIIPDCYQLCAWPLARLTVLHLTLSLNDWLSNLLSESKLKISINIDTRNPKFGMKHPWAYWLRLRKNQLYGACKGYVRAMKEPWFEYLLEGGLRIHPEVYSYIYFEILSNFVLNASFCVLHASLLLCYMLPDNSIIPISNTIYIYCWYKLYFFA